MLSRILIIEPDDTLRKIRADVVKSAGFLPYPASVAEHAITRCKPGAYDAVLLRGSTDHETQSVCTKIKETNPDQLIIALESPETSTNECATTVVNGNDPWGLLNVLRQALSKRDPGSHRQ